MIRSLLAALIALAPLAAGAFEGCPAGQAAARIADAPSLGPGAGPLRVLAIGSSSTEGAGASGPGATYPARLEGLLGARLGRPVAVENAGRGGEVAAATLARLEARLAAQDYALVLWQVGVNDALGGVAEADYAATLAAGIAAIRADGAQAALIDPQALTRPHDPARYARFVALTAEGARAGGAALFPRFAIMSAWRAADLRARLAPDGLHMNDAGYACLAALLAEALTRGRASHANSPSANHVASRSDRGRWCSQSRAPSTVSTRQ